MEQIYYLHDGANQKGPYSIAELKQLKITKDTHVWAEGFSDWKKAGEIKELETILLNVPPPFEQKLPQQISNKTVKSSSWVIVAITVGLVTIGGFIYYVTRESAEASINKVLLEKEAQQELIKQQEEENRKKEEENKRLEELRKIEAEKREIRRNLNSHISIKPNSYSIDRFWGGISNLAFIANNNTNYVIDNIEIEVTYIKKDGGVYTTKTIFIENVPAKSEEYKRVPDVERGVKIDFVIKSINSRTLNLCFQNGLVGSDPEDPYKCN